LLERKFEYLPVRPERVEGLWANRDTVAYGGDEGGGISGNVAKHALSKAEGGATLVVREKQLTIKFRRNP
jgi:hypothetical protein